MAPVAIPGLGNREDVPRPNPAANPVTAGLTAQEGWVFSRVDGHTSFAELFLITGLGESQTVDILRTLVARGLVIAGNGVAATPQPRGATRPPVSAPQQPARVPTR